MDGTWNLEVKPQVVKKGQYEAGIIQKSYTLSYQAVGMPYEKRHMYVFNSDRELEYHIKLLQAGLDTLSK